MPSDSYNGILLKTLTSIDGWHVSGLKGQNLFHIGAVQTQTLKDP